jgi:uncharacterized protein (TIRG00374 family)
LKKQALSVIKYLFFLGIGVFLLYLVFSKVDLNRMVQEIKDADMRFIVLSMLFGVIALWSRAYRWLILLEPLGHKTKMKHSFVAVNLGYFANIAFPRIGEVVRCTILYRMNGTPVAKLFGTVILERVIDLVMLFSLIGVVFIYKINFFGKFFIDFFSEKFAPLARLFEKADWLPIAFFIFVLLILGVLFIYLMRRLKSWGPVKKVYELMHEVSLGFRALFKMKKKWTFIGHTLLIWSMYFFMTWICFFSYEATAFLSKVDGLFMTVVGGLGMSAPVQGGFGAYHFLVEKALLLYKIIPVTDPLTGETYSPGLVFATIVHSSQFIMTLIIGSISLIAFYTIKGKS